MPTQKLFISFGFQVGFFGIKNTHFLGQKYEKIHKTQVIYVIIYIFCRYILPIKHFKSVGVENAHFKKENDDFQHHL